MDGWTCRKLGGEIGERLYIHALSFRVVCVCSREKKKATQALRDSHGKHNSLLNSGEGRCGDRTTRTLNGETPGNVFAQRSEGDGGGMERNATVCTLSSAPFPLAFSFVLPSRGGRRVG